MLSDRFYCAIDILTPIFNNLGAFTPLWDTKAQIFYSPRKKSKLYYVHLLVMFIWSIFQIFQVIRYTLNGNINDFGFVFTFCIAFGMVFEVSILTCYFEKEYLGLINLVISYLRQIHEKYLFHLDPNKNGRTKLLDLALLFLLNSFLSTILISWVIFLVLPQLPTLFANTLPSNAPSILKHFVNLPHFFLGVTASFNVYMLLIFKFLFDFHIIPFIVNELCLGKRQDCYRASSTLRELPTLMMNYREAHIVITVHNNLLGKILFPTQCLITALVSMAGVMILKGRHQLETSQLLLMTAFISSAPPIWGLHLYLEGQLYCGGNKILKSWKSFQWESSNDRKLMGKFARSCKPFYVSNGNAFVIRKVSLLTYIKGLSRALMRALLTLTKWLSLDNS